jgi:hypothetical protein
MTRYLLSALALATAFVTAGCTPPASTAKTDAATTQAPAKSDPASNVGGTSGESASKETQIQTATGVLTRYDDAGYPIFNIGVTPAGGQEVTYMMNDAEAVKPDDLLALKGKPVTVGYRAADEAQVSAVMLAGESLMEPAGSKAAKNPLIASDAVTITGVMSGAGAVTQSDLPSLVTVTAKDGKTLTFEAFVDDRLMSGNGKDVTVHYTMEKVLHLETIAATK